MTFISLKCGAIAILIVPVFLSSAAHALTACIDERPWISYTHPDPTKPAMMQEMAKAAALDVKEELRVAPLPWKRCQEAARRGQVDAIIGAAFLPFNQKLAAFPMTDSSVDEGRSLGTARIVLVRRRGSNANWDGKRFLHTRKEIAVAQGTQIMISVVSSAGAKPDDGSRTDDQNLKKLLLHRVDLMAAYEKDLQALIEPKYDGRVEILPIPLVEAHYYLAFAKSYYAENPQRAERIWNKIAKLKGVR